MGKFKDNKEKTNRKKSAWTWWHLENTWQEKKTKYIYVDVVYTPTIQHDRKKEKKYPTQMNDIVAPGFYCSLHTRFIASLDKWLLIQYC